MKILVACEFSQIVTKAFREKGHEAYSCDILPTEGNPNWHFEGDVTDFLDKGWDLMIAHPPCTYLTAAGAAYYSRNTKKREKAVSFFKKLQEAPISKIAIENPLPFKSVMKEIGRYQQKTDPFEFGEPYRKRTCLWLKNLPELIPTEIVEVKPTGYCIRKTGPRAGKRYNYYYHQGKSSHERSRFFEGIATAMAEQWGAL